MDKLIFLYLIAFPFGKLLGPLPDLVVFAIFIFSIRKNWKNVNNFIVVCLFSLLFSLSFFNLGQIWTGIFYLVRLISYFSLSKIISIKFKTPKRKRLLLNSLIVAGFSVAIFGIIQYLFLPDLRSLKAVGWDDHYFRLVSTFLDPAFTAIILVLTQILFLTNNIKKLNYKKIILSLFLMTCTLLTYSRAGFLALLFSMIFILIKTRQKILMLFIAIFLIAIPLLPKAPSEGTNLLRTYSVNQKFINLNESIYLIKKSPIYGLGFNNLCAAKIKFGLESNPSSHTCSGLDNSILFILATTGIIGLISFTNLILNIIRTTKIDMQSTVFTSLVAVFIHGMFTNTFFYSFVMGWLAIVIGVTRKSITK